MRLDRPFILISLSLAAAAAFTACGGPSSSTIGRSAVSVAQEGRAESGRYQLGPQFENQLHGLLAREAEALGGAREGVPLELNRQVLLNINRFLNEDRGFITRGLSRGSRYIPLMKDIFRSKGLPEDLVYLALIESGFNTTAVSHASAVGPWQFIASTGRRYGLVIDDWVDERRDPVKATHAAADYLMGLHDTFGSWPLAIAGYNSGEGKIIKGMKNYGVSNFWDMSSVGGHLADETKLYVPSFLAAAIIAKDPAAYGLTIAGQAPDRWEEVSLPQAVTLAQAAQYAGATVERLRELNPHLKKAATPPQAAGFILRLPEGSREQFAAAYQRALGGRVQAAVSPPPRPAPGASDLARLRPELEAAAAASSAPLETPMPRTQAAPAKAPAAKAAAAPAVHTVAAGETLGGIALKYGLSVRELMALNGLDGPGIRAGRKLSVRPAPQKAAPAGTVRVVEGDTLYSLARRNKLSVDQLKKLNSLTGDVVRPGQALKIR